MNPMLNISSSPHLKDKQTTKFIMYAVIIALLPATAAGIMVNGLRALLIVAASVAAAVVTEFLFDKACRRPDTWKDGSAAITGLLLALSLSPDVPLALPVLGAVFAILVVKCAFGGLGKNFINPALAGRCFLLISFGRTMSTFTVDGVTSATPLAVLRSGHAVNITKMFLGTGGGVIGASILALLAGGLFLWAIGVINGEISFSILIAFTAVLALFGGQGFDPKFLFAHICGGGVIMGAFFMATDYVTSPVSRAGQIIYGSIIGILGALFRIKGGTADSFSYSIIISNLFVPLIDMYTVPKPFAFTKRAIAIREGAPILPFWKRIPRPVVVLTVISAIAGIALSSVYVITKDTIDEQKKAASAASYLIVCPGAVTLEADETMDQAIEALNGEVYGTSYGRVRINEAYVGKDASGNIAGYVVSVTSSDGFDGNVSLAVGLDPEGRMNGIAFTELNETPGMGMRVDEPLFKDQFSGKMVDKFVMTKSGEASAENEVDTVSGASTTSGAVVNAVNAGLDFFHSTVKGGN
ncbi:MAG: RnfABCDGE type electron transport complex subunit D [Lachnospiraceae bacterium]|nr:RnfABCDGE type electron transport complex subunit D [Lachnospiraceae bacterium]MBQ9401828.1 RnfABCDGE type electron transport complex subunit D [Clostridia bacterium]MBR2532760.1 RnfABCDGE type electron transport complex subunit D [Lachnospiraceae bacterium]